MWNPANQGSLVELKCPEFLLEDHIANFCLACTKILGSCRKEGIWHNYVVSTSTLNTVNLYRISWCGNAEIQVPWHQPRANLVSRIFKIGSWASSVNSFLHSVCVCVQHLAYSVPSLNVSCFYLLWGFFIDYYYCYY